MRTSLDPLGFVVVGITWIYFLLMATLSAECCGLHCSVPGSLQTVQRAEIWGVIFCAAELQGSPSVDNLDVVRHVGRIMVGKEPEKPCELLVDGELLLLDRSLVSKRSQGLVPFQRVRVMQMMRWFAAVGFVKLTR